VQSSVTQPGQATADQSGTPPTIAAALPFWAAVAAATC
jgi:hypothetical protein